MLIFLLLMTAEFIMSCNFREQFALSCFIDDTLFLLQLNDHFVVFFLLIFFFPL